MPLWVTILLSVVALGAGFLFAILLGSRGAGRRLEQARQESEKITQQAHSQAELVRRSAEIEARETIEKQRRELENEVRDKQGAMSALEKRLSHREESLDKRADLLERQEGEQRRKEKEITKREQHAAELETRYQQMLSESQQKLERIAGLTAVEAKKQLMEQMTEEARHESAKSIRLIEEEARQEADRRAKKILATAIQRYAGDFVSEATVSVVQLPSDEMKGRIIGREGRNIRAIEAATGMDLIVDDTPECVIVSGFDPVRREVARLSLEKLIADGRIHPARIEEVVAKTGDEIEKVIKEAGEQATFELGIHGLHPELIRHLGRLKYRTSYSQNQLQHSIETGFFCGIMAAELGLNQRQARRAGLLHDIGKSIDHEVEGSHASIGAELLKKHNEHPNIIHAVAAHHEEIKPESVLAVLVQAADALSGARPGARREMLETYVKRIEELEKISRSFKGVEKSYAIQAGREVRVIVESNRVSDDEVVVLSKEIAAKIEKELSYPGQIRVTVIRETRAVEYAR